MRHITYTTCFDEVLTAVVPNLPDQSSLAYTVPRPPRSAEAGGDYLRGFNELRRLLAFSVQTPDRAVQDLARFERPMIPVLIMAVVAVALLIAAHVFWINTEAAHSPPR